MWMDHGDGYVVPHGDRYAAVSCGLVVIRDADILLHTPLISLGESVDRGRIVAATTPSWPALKREVLEDPTLMELFPQWNRKFEEFVAGGYRTANWSDVILSPRSHDGGFDIAAWKRGRQILDEAKAYKPSLSVSHQIVRAALGLLIEHSGIDQVRVTTTSSFAPSDVLSLESDLEKVVRHRWAEDGSRISHSATFVRSRSREGLSVAVSS